MKKFRVMAGHVLIFVLVLSFGACTRFFNKKGPDEVVKEFVELSASAHGIEDKSKLAELCLGEMRGAFEKLSDQSFKEIYLADKVKIQELKITDTVIEGGEARVSYRVVVENNRGGQTTTEINDREVDLSRSGRSWGIDTIRLKGDKLSFSQGMVF